MTRKAFSLVEIILGMGLITLLLTIGPLALAGTFNSSRKSSVANRIRETGSGAINSMAQKIKFSQEAKCPGDGYPDSVEITDITLTKTIFYRDSQYSLKSGVKAPGEAGFTEAVSFLPSDNSMFISGCSDYVFSCSADNKTITICFNLSTNNITASDPNYYRSKFETQVRLRNTDL